MRKRTLAAVATAVVALGTLECVVGHCTEPSVLVTTAITDTSAIAIETSTAARWSRRELRWRWRLATEISTEDANVGDQWTGTLDQPVIRRGQVLIPEGSQVVGAVTAAQQGTRETRPEIDLAVRRVMVNGRMRSLTADTEPIIGGSNRAKKIGAIVGGAAVGGLLGHAIDHEHGGLIGGLLGGAAGYGATAARASGTLTLRPGQPGHVHDQPGADGVALARSGAITRQVSDPRLLLFAHSSAA